MNIVDAHLDLSYNALRGRDVLRAAREQPADDEGIPTVGLPDLLMLSAGFDAHRDDPLAAMEVSDDGFARITRLMVDLANRHCDGRIVSTLEGGYSLPALGRSVVRHLLAMSRE